MPIILKGAELNSMLVAVLKTYSLQYLEVFVKEQPGVKNAGIERGQASQELLLLPSSKVKNRK